MDSHNFISNDDSTYAESGLDYCFDEFVVNEINKLEYSSVTKNRNLPFLTVRFMDILYPVPNLSDADLLAKGPDSYVIHLSKGAIKYNIVARFLEVLVKLKLNIKDVVGRNRNSLAVDYKMIEQIHPCLVHFLQNSAAETLKIFDEATKMTLESSYKKFAKLGLKMVVRIVNFPTITPIFEIRRNQWNQLIRIRGIVTGMTRIMTRLSIVYYRCKCDSLFGPFVQSNDQEIKPDGCSKGCTSKFFKIDDRETIYENFQRMTIQESPSDIGFGRVPRSKDVILLEELCDICRPGDDIDLTGTYMNFYHGSLNIKAAYPIFSSVIVANNIIVLKDFNSEHSLTEKDNEEIIQLSKDPYIFQRIVASICPSIFGHEHVKRAIALSLFGSNPTTTDGSKVRGDIHVLIIGDPGTAKSQFLKFTAKVAPKAVYTSGQGVSGVGLTACVQLSAETKEWVLQAGAFVLANDGVCLIDEFDKISEIDRVSIHEAMEQQTISISKANIQATLRAECAVIAAGNPIQGLYRNHLSFYKNVKFDEPLISRFDIICIVKDEIDDSNDRKLARFVAQSHIKNHRKVEDHHMDSLKALDTESAGRFEPIDQKLLKKYIKYARSRHRLEVKNDIRNIVTKAYLKMRSISSAISSTLITTRCVQSILRLAKAITRLHLRTRVTIDDAANAVKIVIDSFISTLRIELQERVKEDLKDFLLIDTLRIQTALNALQEMVAIKVIALAQVSGTNFIEISEVEFRNKCYSIGLSPELLYKSEIFAKEKFTLMYNPNRIRLERTYR